MIDLKSEIIQAWIDAKPVSLEDARLIADDILKDAGREKTQFREWFDKFGQQAIDRINRE